MNYKKKRMKAGISFYTMSKELGITEKELEEVENKKRRLEGNLINKFQEIIENAKQIKFDRKVRMMNINMWFKDGSGKKALSDYGYSQRELAEQIGTSQAIVSRALNGQSAGDDEKEKIYDFLTNPIKKKISEFSDKDLKMSNLQKRIQALNISQKNFAKIADVSQATVSYVITGIREVSEKSRIKIFNALEKLEKEQQEKVKVLESMPVEEQRDMTMDETLKALEDVFNDTEDEEKNAEVTLNENEIENIELVDEIPEGAEVTDGVEIVTSNEESVEENTDENIKEYIEEEISNEDLIALTEDQEIEITLLKEKVRKLERQIYIYEKLIERL